MRVTVVDDSIIVREGLNRLLLSEGHEVVGSLSRPEHVAAAVTAEQPDAVVLDIRMPPTFTDEGLQVASTLRTMMPSLAILVLSQYGIPEYAALLLKQGAAGTGYLLKDRILVPLQLSQALQRLVQGGTVIDPDVVGELMAAPSRLGAIALLTERELEVLKLMAEGLSDKGIAERLVVSVHTVGTHVRHIFQKLDLPAEAVGNRRVLAVLAYLDGCQ
ncbi:response regulator [Streptomyces sp. NPDC021080]|uniref:response regulator n=1 Tax=Streptomyces sp. NPDC021080 TaxID=3365110 RepID=UPI0037ADCF29